MNKRLLFLTDGKSNSSRLKPICDKMFYRAVAFAAAFLLAKIHTNLILGLLVLIVNRTDCTII